MDKSRSEVAHVTGVDMLLGSYAKNKLNKRIGGGLEFLCLYNKKIDRGGKIELYQEKYSLVVVEERRENVHV